MRFVAPLLAVALFASFATPASASGGGSSAPAQAPATRQERLTSAETYLPMPTLSAGVLQRNDNQGTIVVDMGLDIPDADLRHRALLNAPRIRDALRTALSSYSSTYYRVRTAPDPTELTRHMQLAVNRVLGGPGARVLLANIIYQRPQRQ
ncbi:MAG: flagellar basal body-associated FliL family protein [Hyphomonadaceae bacterium]|nr:flagellar basal body-associated FliL family protein [Hyphomonadaceae bacterium]